MFGAHLTYIIACSVAHSQARVVVGDLPVTMILKELNIMAIFKGLSGALSSVFKAVEVTANAVETAAHTLQHTAEAGLIASRKLRDEALVEYLEGMGYEFQSLDEYYSAFNALEQLNLLPKADERTSRIRKLVSQAQPKQD